MPASEVSEGVRLPNDRSPGRNANAGDFVYYDPWAGEVITAAEARELRQIERPIPCGHPRGFVFVDDDGDDDLSEVGSLMTESGSPIQEIDITGDGPSSANAVATATAQPTQPRYQTGGAGASIDPQPAIIRDFIRSLSAPVSDAVTDVAQLRALAGQWLPDAGPSQGGGPSGL